MKLLTGKCLRDFKDFVSEKYHLCADYADGSFYSLPEICQYAIIIDYFDSVGIIIAIPSEFDSLLKYNGGFEAIISIDGLGFISLVALRDDVFETRKEATIEAIKKANRIRNEQLNK